MKSSSDYVTDYDISLGVERAGEELEQQRHAVAGAAAAGQGLTLVRFSAQPKPFWSHLHVPPCLIKWGIIMTPTYPSKCAYVEPKSGRV